MASRRHGRPHRVTSDLARYQFELSASTGLPLDLGR
jgi:hypothetical protein